LILYENPSFMNMNKTKSAEKVKKPNIETGIPFPGGNSEYLLLFTISQLNEGLISQKLLVSA